MTNNRSLLVWHNTDDNDNNDNDEEEEEQENTIQVVCVTVQRYKMNAQLYIYQVST